MSKKLSDLQELSEVQKECARLMCVIDNKNEIARRLHKNVKTISAWSNLDLFKKEMNKYRNEMKEHAQEKLCRNIDIATDKLIELITSTKTTDSVRLQAINTLYDRTLGKVTTKIETKDTTKQITNVEDIKEMLNDIDIQVQDVDYIEDNNVDVDNNNVDVDNNNVEDN